MNINKIINNIIHKISQPPEDVNLELRRNYITVRIAYIIILCIHCLLPFVFFLINENVLVLFNFFSIFFYIFILYIYNKKFLITSLVLSSIEICIHQYLCTYYLGWGSGFQYYLIAWGSGIIIFPFRKKYLKLIVPVLCIIAFTALFFLSKKFPVSVKHDPSLINIFNIINILLPFFTLVSVVFYFEIIASKAESALRVENERAENLLLNILPEEIAERLKSNQENITEASDETTILFADICDFTKIAERMSPDNLVKLLNKIFSEFDDLVDKYNLEKIKTIGDSYMVASGIPVPRDDHAEAMADFALDMLKIVKKYKFKNGKNLQIRVGFHSGSSIAGVIGKKKFTYDIWGDIVNTASRMEAYGQPGKIQVTATTYDKLKDKYEFEERGQVDIKGKGVMQTYFLVQRRSS